MLGDDVRRENAIPDHYRRVVRTLVIGPEDTPIAHLVARNRSIAVLTDVCKRPKADLHK